MADTTTVFDWRAYAREKGVPTWRVWIALRDATRQVRVPSGHRPVVSPADVDRLATDPDQYDFIRQTIDQTTR